MSRHLREDLLNFPPRNAALSFNTLGQGLTGNHLHQDIRASHIAVSGKVVSKYFGDWNRRHCTNILKRGDFAFHSREAVVQFVILKSPLTFMAFVLLALWKHESSDPFDSVFKLDFRKYMFAAGDDLVKKCLTWEFASEAGGMSFQKLEFFGFDELADEMLHCPFIG